jgi:hypothetical protein
MYSKLGFSKLLMGALGPGGQDTLFRHAVLACADIRQFIVMICTISSIQLRRINNLFVRGGESEGASRVCRYK